MRKKITLLIWLSFFSIVSFGQETFFKISIIQDSIAIAPDAANEVKLQKRLFKIQVELQNLDGVYLFAAFKDSIYKINDKESLYSIKDIPAMCMAEESFNPDQELIINDEGWSYWFYNPKEDWHRFDKEITIAGKKVIASKSVKQFYVLPAEKKLTVAEVAEPLYLFFFSGKDNKKGELVKDLQRKKLKITWQ